MMPRHYLAREFAERIYIEQAEEADRILAGIPSLKRIPHITKDGEDAVVMTVPKTDIDWISFTLAKWFKKPRDFNPAWLLGVSRKVYLKCEKQGLNPHVFSTKEEGFILVVHWNTLSEGWEGRYKETFGVNPAEVILWKALR